MNQQMGTKCEEKSEAEDAGFADDVERGNDSVESGAFANADDVEKTKAGDESEHCQKVEPRMDGIDERRKQLTRVVDRAPSEERDVDGEVEQYRPTCDETEDIAESSHHEVLSAAGDRVRGRQLRIG